MHVWHRVCVTMWLQQAQSCILQLHRQLAHHYSALLGTNTTLL